MSQSKSTVASELPEQVAPKKHIVLHPSGPMVWFRTNVSWVEPWVSSRQRRQQSPGHRPSPASISLLSLESPWASSHVACPHSKVTHHCNRNHEFGTYFLHGRHFTLHPPFLIKSIWYYCWKYLTIELSQKMHHKMLGFIPTCSCYQKKTAADGKTQAIPPSVNIRLLRLPSIGIPRHALVMAGASETIFLAAEERRRFLKRGAKQ